MNPMRLSSIPVPVQIPFSTWPENLEKNLTFVFSHLLPDILSYFPDSDLLHRLRLVSKLWREEVTTILRRRKTTRCTFEYLATEKTFILKYPHPLPACSHSHKKIGNDNENDNEPVNPKPLKLTEFSQLLSGPFQTFPSSWFSFLSGSLNHPEALEFFSAHGSKVKRLTVDIHLNSRTPTGFLPQRIFKLTPNLEILEFFTSPSSPHLQLEWFLPQSKTALCQNQNQNQVEGQNQPALLPFLYHVYWQGFVKTEGIGGVRLADVSSVLNSLRSNSIAPQLYSLYISDLELTGTQSYPENPNQNEGISILKTLSSTFNLRFGTLTFSIFSPTECPLSLLEAVGDESFDLRTQGLTLGNGNLDSGRVDSRPSKAHLIRVRRALWRIMKNNSDILENITCSFKAFNLLTRIPFQPRIFPKLSNLLISSTLFVEGTDPVTMAMEPAEFFQCDTNWSDDLNKICWDLDLDFPPHPLWTDLTSVAPSLKKIELVLAQFSPEVEEWLVPCLSQGQLKHRDTNSSVEHLKISGRSVSFHSEILGKLIKCFPHLKKIEIHSLQAPAFLPLVEQGNLSTLQELLCFLFGIQNPVEMDNEIEIKTDFSVGVAIGDDPVPKTTTIPTLLNLKNLQELWVSFSLCQIAEKREFLGLTGQLPTTSLRAALQMQYCPPGQFDRFFGIPTLPVSLFGPPTNKCFLSRIPNLRHFGRPNDLKHLYIYCSDHDI